MSRKILIYAGIIMALCTTACTGTKSGSVSSSNENQGKGTVISNDIGVFSSQAQQKEATAVDISMQSEENTYTVRNGNVVNGGIVFEAGDKIYYYNKTMSNRLYCRDAQENVSPVGDISGAMDINVTGDGIIYQTGQIMYYNNETQTASVIVDGTCRNVIVSGDRLYYLKLNNDIYNIFSNSLAGDDEKCLSKEIASYMNIYDGRIYYINGNDEGRIHHISTDGTDDRQFAGFTSVEEMVVEDGVIYYVTASSQGNQLWKIGVDGSGDTKLSSKSCRSINVMDGKVYFSDRENNELAVIGTDGEGYTVLDEATCSNINLTDEWIYYFKNENMNYCRIRKVGTELSQVE